MVARHAIITTGGICLRTISNSNKHPVLYPLGTPPTGICFVFTCRGRQISINSVGRFGRLRTPTPGKKSRRESNPWSGTSRQICSIHVSQISTHRNRLTRSHTPRRGNSSPNDKTLWICEVQEAPTGDLPGPGVDFFAKKNLFQG